MKCNFRFVPPHELHSVWPTIRPGLEITAKKAPGGWIPEDVYLSIKTGDAVLHTAIVDSYYKGFLVSKAIDTLEGRKLLLWICHIEDDLLDDNLEQVKEWAKNIGAVKIQFQSPRNGWERRAEALGFTPTMIVYETDV